MWPLAKSAAEMGLFTVRLAQITGVLFALYVLTIGCGALDPSGDLELCRICAQFGGTAVWSARVVNILFAFIPWLAVAVQGEGARRSLLKELALSTAGALVVMVLAGTVLDGRLLCRLYERVTAGTVLAPSVHEGCRTVAISDDQAGIAWFLLVTLSLGVVTLARSEVNETQS